MNWDFLQVVIIVALPIYLYSAYWTYGYTYDRTLCHPLSLAAALFGPIYYIDGIWCEKGKSPRSYNPDLVYGPWLAKLLDFRKRKARAKLEREYGWEGV